MTDNKQPHPDEALFETAPPVPNPITVEYCVEVFSNGYTREHIESWVKEQGLEQVALMAEAHAKLRYNGIEFSELEEQFGCAFSHEEAEAVVAGFDGDLDRASPCISDLRTAMSAL